MAHVGPGSAVAPNRLAYLVPGRDQHRGQVGKCTARPEQDLRHEVATEVISVRERMIAVMDALHARDVIEFDQIFRIDEAVSPSRTMVVVTFLAILELVRLSALRLYQGLGEDGVPEGPIHVRPAADGRGGEWQQHVSRIT